MKQLLVRMKLGWQSFVAELKCRVKSETPLWFKRIRRASVKLSSVAIALLGADAWITGFTLPDILRKICSYIIIAGITAGFVSSTACKSTPQKDTQ